MKIASILFPRISNKIKGGEEVSKKILNKINKYVRILIFTLI